MTGLTVDQWKALDEAERDFAALDNAIGLSWEAEHRVVTRLRDRLTTHARFLIDAARPKCPTCDGSLIVETPGCVCAEECWTCVDTDHPGWAA